MTTITITTINQIALCSNLSLTWLVSFFCFDFGLALAFPMPITHLRHSALSLFGRFKPKFKSFTASASYIAHFTVFERGNNNCNSSTVNACHLQRLKKGASFTIIESKSDVERTLMLICFYIEPTIFARYWII